MKWKALQLTVLLAVPALLCSCTGRGGMLSELERLEEQNRSDSLFKAEGGEIIGRHAAYRVEGVDGYGITDAVGRKGKDIYIIEAKNGKNPRFTNFQKKAFPKMMDGAKIVNSKFSFMNTQ